jgi:uncharacterized membrane protein YfcA
MLITFRLPSRTSAHQRTTTPRAGGLLLGSAALAPALLVGQQLGVRIQDRLDGALFNRLVLIAVGISGTSLLVRSLA